MGLKPLIAVVFWPVRGIEGQIRSFPWFTIQDFRAKGACQEHEAN